MRAASRPCGRLSAADRVYGLSRVWSGLITTPIRDGRLRDTGWPVGLRPIVVVGVVAFALAVLLMLLAPVIRAALPLSVTVGATGGVSVKLGED